MKASETTPEYHKAVKEWIDSYHHLDMAKSALIKVIERREKVTDIDPKTTEILKLQIEYRSARQAYREASILHKQNKDKLKKLKYGIGRIVE